MVNLKAGLLACVMALAPSLHALAQGAPKGSAEAAKSKVSACIGCHGIPMYHTAYPEVYRVPMIAGQSSQYIVHALGQYKSGERNHPSMQAIAKSLSEQDMADVAAYYGGATDQAAR